ncbi:MAG: hypothetical protein HY074_13135, partial [Deltaproteobacteria bacterium]|nr:hypothetical protein [Deltaproteobacteria bacterium]
RLNGMLLIPALVVHAWVNRKTLSRRQLKGILGIAAAMSGGWFVYLCMNRYLYDNWTYFLAQTSKQWGINLALPFTGVWTAIQMWGGRSAEEKITIIIMEVGFTLVALALTPLLARRSRALEFTYVALNMLLFVSMDFWLSRPRYLLTLFPLFIAVAPWISRGPLRLALYLFGSAALFGIYWALYLNAQWAH